mmetsp:Transcript_91480/g.261312  ORF Transcript_91480/g.261312 Transcript_91480/m.261312 type:complete len:204 (-) Transcript_91480:1606-2217(-)
MVVLRKKAHTVVVYALAPCTPGDVQRPVLDVHERAVDHLKARHLRAHARGGGDLGPLQPMQHVVPGLPRHVYVPMYDVLQRARNPLHAAPLSLVRPPPRVQHQRPRVPRHMEVALAHVLECPKDALHAAQLVLLTPLEELVDAPALFDVLDPRAPRFVKRAVAHMHDRANDSLRTELLVVLQPLVLLLEPPALHHHHEPRAPC